MRRPMAYLPLLLLFCALQTALAQDLASFENRVQVEPFPMDLPSCS